MNLVRYIIRLWGSQKRFFLVNIIGLAIGLAVSILLLLYVYNELSFDKHFVNKDRIVRLNSIWIESGTREFFPICLRSAYSELPQKTPGIEKALQIYRGGDVEVFFDDQRFQDVQLLYSDTAFFSLFNFEILSGNTIEALKVPFSAILTLSQANKLFGKASPLGKTFKIKNELYTVSAVIADIPWNTHFQFDILVSTSSVSNLENYGGLEFFTYYLLDTKTSHASIIPVIENTYRQMLKTNFNKFNATFDAKVEKLVDLHLFSQSDFDLSQPGSIKTVLFMVLLAFLVLALAIVNFINLFIIHGESRSTEIGIRKVNGAGMKKMVQQFFGEASVFVILSFIVGLVLVWWLIPAFSQLIAYNIEPGLFFSPLFLITLLVLLFIIIAASGFYPAIYLAKLKPVAIIKTGSAKFNRKKWMFTLVVVFQSTITIFLISMLFIFNKQVHHLKSVPLGYNPENVLIVSNINSNIAGHFQSIKEKLLAQPFVVSVGTAQHRIGGGVSGQGVYRYGDRSENSVSINEYRVHPGTCETFGLQLIKGRFFHENDSADQSRVIINETAVKRLGLTDPIGKRVVMFSDPMEIVGVVKDFYYETTASVIQPLVLTNYTTDIRYAFIRVGASVNKNEALQTIESVFKAHDKDFVMNTQWSSTLVSARFNRENILSESIAAGTILSVIIALLGLFAINSYLIARRTKEIGIRKVSGSSSLAIILLISRDILQWIGVAGCVAIPFAYWVLQSWLNNYANRIDLNFGLFAIPFLLQIALTIVITFFETWRAATRNPVESLRYE